MASYIVKVNELARMSPFGPIRSLEICYTGRQDTDTDSHAQNGLYSEVTLAKDKKLLSVDQSMVPNCNTGARANNC